MTASLKRHTFLGLADIYSKPYGTAGALNPFGSISQAAIAFEEENIDIQNYGRSGGKLNRIPRLTDVTLSLTLQELPLSNISLLTRGTQRSENNGTVADEAHVVKIGGFAPLKGITQTSVVVKNEAGDVTYINGVHYRVGGSGIQWLDGETDDVPALEDDDDVEVSYSHLGIDIVEALTASGGEYQVHFDGLNEAENNHNVVVDIWRWKPNLVQNIAIISDEAVTAEISGSVLLDNTQTLSGRSKFFRWVYPKAA